MIDEWTEDPQFPQGAVYRIERMLVSSAIIRGFGKNPILSGKCPQDSREPVWPEMVKTAGVRPTLLVRKFS